MAAILVFSEFPFPIIKESTSKRIYVYYNTIYTGCFLLKVTFVSYVKKLLSNIQKQNLHHSKA